MHQSSSGAVALDDRRHGSPARDESDGISAPVGGRAVRREAAAVAAVSGLVYLLTLSNVPALTHDTMTYMEGILVGGDGLYHPHHLLYNWLARGWLDLAGALGIGADPVRVAASLNAVVGACATALVWTILRLRALAPRGLAAAATAGAAASYGLWFYSVSVEVYLLPLALLLATFLVLTSPDLTPRTMVALGLLNGLAVVAHQANVVFALVAVLVVARRVDRPLVLRRIAAYSAAAALVVGAAYGAVFALALQPASGTEAADWLTSYAQSDAYWRFEPRAPVEAAAGFGRALVGGHFAFRLDSVQDRMTSTFADNSLVDETYLVHDLPPALSLALVGVAVVGVGTLVGVIARGLLRRRGTGPDPRRVLGPLATWLAVYTAVFVFWEPRNPEFWIPQVTVVWLIAAALACGPAPSPPDGPTATGAARAGTRMLVAAAVAIGLANLVGTILPATSRANDIYAVRYRVLDRLVDEGGLVVVDHPHLMVGYARRFTPAEPVAVSDYTTVVQMGDEPRAPAAEDIVDRVEETLASGDAVAVDGQLVEDPSEPHAERAADALTTRFGSDWRRIDVRGAPPWFLLEP